MMRLIIRGLWGDAVPPLIIRGLWGDAVPPIPVGGKLIHHRPSVSVDPTFIWCVYTMDYEQMFTQFLKCVGGRFNYFLAHRDEHIAACDILSHFVANGQLSDNFKAACRQCLERDGFFQDDGERCFNAFMYRLIGEVGVEIDTFRMTCYRALQFVGWLPIFVKETSAYRLFLTEKKRQGLSDLQASDAWLAVKGTDVELEYQQQASCIDDAKRKNFFETFIF